MPEAGGLEDADRPYRFGVSTGWLAHAFKSATRQDHAGLRAMLRGVLPEGGVAIDVGAHGGQVTRLLAGLAGAPGHVYAVEPSGYTRSILRTALWARRVRNVTVVAAALGAEAGVAPLRTPLKARGDMGYGLAHIAGAPATRRSVVEFVAMVTLDQLVDALALRRLDFIKVDIEGYEAALIEGASRTLARYRPALLLEQDAGHLARAGSTLGGLWARMRQAGYRPFRPLLPGPALEGLEAPAEGDILWRPE